MLKIGYTCRHNLCTTSEHTMGGERSHMKVTTINIHVRDHEFYTANEVLATSWNSYLPCAVDVSIANIV